MRYLGLLVISLFISPVLFAKGAKKTTGLASDKNVTVVMETSMGTVEIALDEKKAPLTVKNFLNYVNEKYYDGTVFHRVIGSFMIQGGGFELKEKKITQKKTKEPVANEGKNGLKNLTGTIAMARTGEPNSATSQFFINVADNAGLDYPKPDGHGYAVFGKVTAGMDVVNKIKSVKTGMKSVMARGRDGKLNEATFRDVPEKNVVIKSIRVKKTKAKS